jgi:pilus assembly protein Flp/PilA
MGRGGIPIKGRKYMLQFITEALIALRERQEGQAMVEYALILGLISVVAIAALTLIGQDVNGILNAVEAALGAVPGA